MESHLRIAEFILSPLPLDEAYFRGLHPLCVWRYRWASKLRLPIPRAYPYRQSRVLEGQARCIIHLPELTYLLGAESYSWRIRRVDYLQPSVC